MTVLKFDDKIPIYIQIKNYLYRRIITGDLQPGEKLPSVRQLAVDVTANVNTVQRALSEMLANKVIESQRGKGNFVTADEEMISNLKTEVVHKQISIAYEELHNLKLTDEEIITEFQQYIHDRSAQNA